MVEILTLIILNIKSNGKNYKLKTFISNSLIKRGLGL